MIGEIRLSQFDPYIASRYLSLTNAYPEINSYDNFVMTCALKSILGGFSIKIVEENSERAINLRCF